MVSFDVKNREMLSRPNQTADIEESVMSQSSVV